MNHELALSRLCPRLRFRGWLVVVVAIALLSALDAFAANRYVRAGGAGTQDGSDWVNAYPELPSALVRGDTYYIADGEYRGRSFNTAASGTTFVTIKKATPEDHGTNTGWSDSYGDGQAIFTSGLYFSTSYWVIDGQTGGGATNGWDKNFGFKVIEKGDSTPVIGLGSPGAQGTANNITIRHVHLEGKGSVATAGGGYSNDGLAVYGSSNVTLSYFRMTGIGRCPFFVSPRNLVAEHGWVESYNGSSAVHSEVASIWAFAGSVGDVTFRHNLFTDIRSTGGIMWDNSSNSDAKLNIYGNVFFKPAGASWDRANGVIGGWTGSNGEAFRNATVNNNTFINVDQAALSTLPQRYSNNVAYNNVFYNSSSPDFSRFGQHDYNHFINSGGAHSEVNGTSASSGDPFVNFVGFDFRLKAATAGGIALASPFNMDPLSAVRGVDGVVDRGAFEFRAGSAAALAAPTNLIVN